MTKRASPKYDPKCPHCGGDFASGGTERRRVPLGFGFNGSPDFQIDCIEIKSHIGFCIECGKDGKVEFSRRKVTLKPRSINRKIRAKFQSV